MRMKYSRMHFRFKIKIFWDVMPCSQTDVSEEWAATILMVEILYPEDLENKVPETSLWLQS